MKEHEAKVAHELALRLRANAFERWLCAEALAVLVASASETLRELSDGQYELALSDKTGDIEVIDFGEAGMRRSARTLSGGETFQAALALALALSGAVARDWTPSSSTRASAPWTRPRSTPSPPRSNASPPAKIA